MTLDSPPAGAPIDRDRAAPPPTHHTLENDTLPWTGLSVLLAVLGLILFLAVPGRPLAPEELDEQRLSAHVRLAYGALRGAIEDYRSEHGHAPGTHADGSFHARDFQRQLVLSTDADGHAVPQAIPSHPYGPYLPGELPANPINGRRDVRIVTEAPLSSRIDGRSGWLYDPVADELCLNAPGQWGAYRGQGFRF